MSIKRQIQYLRSDKALTISSLNMKGVENISNHGFDHFPDDILSIKTNSPAPFNGIAIQLGHGFSTTAFGQSTDPSQEV